MLNYSYEAMSCILPQIIYLIYCEILNISDGLIYYDLNVYAPLPAPYEPGYILYLINSLYQNGSSDYPVSGTYVKLLNDIMDVGAVVSVHS